LINLSRLLLNTWYLLDKFFSSFLIYSWFLFAFMHSLVSRMML
jgi:hypothetical protein